MMEPPQTPETPPEGLSTETYRAVLQAWKEHPALLHAPLEAPLPPALAKARMALLCRERNRAPSQPAIGKEDSAPPTPPTRPAHPRAEGQASRHHPAPSLGEADQAADQPPRDLLPAGEEQPLETNRPALPVSDEALERCARVLTALTEADGLLIGLAADHPRLKALLEAVTRLDRQCRRQEASLRRTAPPQVQEPKPLEHPWLKSRPRPPATALILSDRHFRAEASGSGEEGEGSEDLEALSHAVCYVCRQPGFAPHPAYPRLCQDCGAFNLARRQEQVDLSGRFALVTGARIKSGYHTVLRLLRAGATVMGTTRFPHDAARRFAREADLANWQQRLHLYRLDFLSISAVEAFADFLAQQYPHLDILINNAARTVDKPAEVYAPLYALEAPESLPRALHGLLPPAPALGLTRPFQLGAGDVVSQPTLEPAWAGEGDLPDLRERNTWVQKAQDVPTEEVLAVQAINATAPFVLTTRLRPMMARSPAPSKHVVHVSAPEGQFYPPSKSSYHPHTNMAKAALNMMTRTCSPDFARDGIYMNSVDPGWFSIEQPRPIAERMRQEGFTLPLDAVDAAARICHPVYAAIREGIPFHGLLLKDYRPVLW